MTTGTPTPPVDHAADLTAVPFAAALRWAVHALVYLLVLVVAAITLAPPASGADLGLVGLLAVFTTVYSLGARRALRHSPGPDGSWWALGYLLPSIAVWAVGFLLSPNAVWIAFGLDFAVLYALPILGGVLALALVTALAVAGFAAWSADPGLGELIGPVIGAGVALAVVLTVRALQHEVDRRTRLARQLAEARDTIAEQTRAAATAAERDRIASELHDTVAQSVQSIHLLLDAAERALAREDLVETRRLVQEARTTAARTGGQTRRFVDAGDADSPVGAELAAHLRVLLDEAGAVGGLETRLRLDLDVAELDALPRSSSRALLRLVESLLANAVQHADARRIGVSIARDGGLLILDVVDDGRGFDPQAAAGFGLRSARARAASVGGSLVIESAPGEGTAVQVILPAAPRTDRGPGPDHPLSEASPPATEETR